MVDMSHVESFNGGENVRSTFYRYGSKLYLTPLNAEGWRVVGRLHGKAYVPSDSEFLGRASYSARRYSQQALLARTQSGAISLTQAYRDGLEHDTAIYPSISSAACALFRTASLSTGVVVAQVPDGILFKFPGLTRRHWSRCSNITHARIRVWNIQGGDATQGAALRGRHGC